ncbi:hypothetical protein OE88DRAFT_1647471 [Heliocybe sulcata]|uniref:Uncharacterized protein n=1 Tax=Heliocybe sulcata TaxID=5364 RepID=A0A5C3MTG0_9AGAM|nr:hypothetical protein OE88DRAFT_1647471 [Heliocybe sulcata]
MHALGRNGECEPRGPAARKRATSTQESVSGPREHVQPPRKGNFVASASRGYTACKALRCYLPLWLEKVWMQGTTTKTCDGVLVGSTSRSGKSWRTSYSAMPNDHRSTSPPTPPSCILQREELQDFGLKRPCLLTTKTYGLGKMGKPITIYAGDTLLIFALESEA